jgi:nicotinate-nucleotide pyrophosphorylase (carboxylating)
MEFFRKLHPIQMDRAIEFALQEDWAFGDWTADLAVDQSKKAKAKIIAKQDCTIAGVEVAQRVFEIVDKTLVVTESAQNSLRLKRGEPVLQISGSARSILKAERVALNFLMHMSGIATYASQLVDAVEGTKVQILDTRKNTPGLRIFEKHATALGGARNHRFCLSDGVIVKENHIRAAGGVANTLSSMSAHLPPGIKKEVEVTNLEELEQAVAAGADIVMLDNMSTGDMKTAVKNAGDKVLLEASGNVTLESVRKIAETGVDFISTSAMVHSSKWADLSLLFEYK